MISYVGPRLVCLAVFSVVAVGAWAQNSSPLNPNGLRASVGTLGGSNVTPAPKLSPEMRGDIYMARKMYRDAIDMYRQGPVDSAVIVNKIGIAFHQLLQLDLARKSYQAAIKLDPKYSEAINNLGTIYYAQKNYKKAITYYRRSLKFSGSAASVYSNLGAAYFARKDYKHASEYYEQALRLDPDVFEHRGGSARLCRSVRSRNWLLSTCILPRLTPKTAPTTEP